MDPLNVLELVHVNMFLPILYIIYTHIYTNINIFIIALFYYIIFIVLSDIGYLRATRYALSIGPRAEIGSNYNLISRFIFFLNASTFHSLKKEFQFPFRFPPIDTGRGCDLGTGSPWVGTRLRKVRRWR